MQSYDGRCQCGDTKIRLFTPRQIVSGDLRTCRCIFCSIFDGTYYSHPDSSMTVNASCQLERRYQGAGIAAMLFCSNCEDFLGTSCDFNGKQLGAAVINRFCSLKNMKAGVHINPAGKSKKDKMERWRSIWMPITIYDRRSQ